MKNENKKISNNKKSLDQINKNNSSSNQTHFESNEKTLKNNLNWFEFLLSKSFNVASVQMNNNNIVEKDNIDSQIQNNSTAPKNRWFNSIMAFLLASIFVLLGVIVVCLFVIFA
ncbi:MAG: hypothetical protein K2J69_00375 [Malacoplasma sp.]|nr:hypothetical protein [Malacoplasma sp.]